MFDYNTLVTNRSAADVTARNDKGTYNSTDLNRIGEAMKDLSAALNSLGYNQTVTPKTNWTPDDWANPSAAAVLLRDLTTIRSTLAVRVGTPETPKTMERMTFGTANDIERILLTVSQLIDLLEQGRPRCGGFGFYSGAMPLPTEGKLTPAPIMRTWAELDQLGLSWADWDRMTWDQLLYG